MNFKHVCLSYGGVLFFSGQCSSCGIANLRRGPSKLHLSIMNPTEPGKRSPTKEQAWKPCRYIQYRTINGSRWPTCKDGAVGSTPA